MLLGVFLFTLLHLAHPSNILEHVIDIHLLCVTVKKRLRNFKITRAVRNATQSTPVHNKIKKRKRKRVSGIRRAGRYLSTTKMLSYYWISFSWLGLVCEYGEVWADTSDDDDQQQQLAHWCFIPLVVIWLYRPLHYTASERKRSTHTQILGQKNTERAVSGGGNGNIIPEK